MAEAFCSNPKCGLSKKAVVNDSEWLDVAVPFGTFFKHERAHRNLFVFGNGSRRYFCDCCKGALDEVLRDLIVMARG